MNLLSLLEIKSLRLSNTEDTCCALLLASKPVFTWFSADTSLALPGFAAKIVSSCCVNGAVLIGVKGNVAALYNGLETFVRASSAAVKSGVTACRRAKRSAS